jgi:hypothetical protein
VRPESACSERVAALDLPTHTISLDGSCEAAAIFPQFVDPATLQELRNREVDPLTIPPEHNPERLDRGVVLGTNHLHIIIQKPDIGEFPCLL